MSGALPAALGWRFSTRDALDVDQDPTEGDQFNSEDVQREEALIREATQNSQDAARGTHAPVRVRLSLAEKPHLDGGLLRALTAPLLPHLKAIDVSPDLEEAQALVVEDFGTTGLTGPWDVDSDPGPFRSFWFRHGRSFKGQGQGGRWGLGKLTFPFSSRTRCHFGLTVRPGEPAGLLLGQAVLRTHMLGGFKHAPHGHWGDASNGGLEPVRDAAFLKRFADAFGLERGAEPGLSVVVPWPRQMPDERQLIKYVVQNYAFPILTGRLVFEVLGAVVDDRTVRTLGRSLLPAGLIDFIDEAHATGGKGLMQLAPPRLDNQSYRIGEDLLDAGALDTLRQRYAAGERVGLRVPVSLQRKADKAETASFVDVHLKATAELPDGGGRQKGETLYVRGEITVPKEAGRARLDTCFALLRASDPTMSEFLGDAENPAHTEWSHTAERFMANWHKRDYAKLRLVKTCVPALHKLLASGQLHTDRNALIEFFSVPDATSGKGGQGRPKPGVVKVIVPKPDVKPVERILAITKVEGGFTVRPGPGFAGRSKPAKVNVMAAYDVADGDAFKAWRKFDFDFSDDQDEIACEVEGAASAWKNNRIQLTVPGDDFRLSVTGFDPGRDLIVDAKSPTKSAGASDA